MDYIAIISILSIFLGAPLIVFSFIYLDKRNKLRIEELKLRKEVLELELDKEELRLKLMEAEGKKYDRIIEGGNV